MQIRRIEELDYQVFGDFTWPKDLLEFADLNVIYAPNGSGKSTLARVMRMAAGDLEVESVRTRLVMEESPDLVLGDLANGDTERLLPAKVFDQDFRRQALGSLQGIRWSIGRDEVSKEKRLEELAQERQRHLDLAAASSESARNADIALSEFLEVENTEIRGLLNVLSPRANHGASRVRSRFLELERQIESDGPGSIPDELSPEMSRILRRDLDDDTPREHLKPLGWSDVIDRLQRIARTV